MIERTVLQTTLKETAFKEILRESFQDFDLLDYKYSVNFELGIKADNNYKDYKDFYRVKAFTKNKAITYKYYLNLNFSFEPKVFNKVQFDDFFDDGLTKLNCLLERYNIEIPYKKAKCNVFNSLKFSFYEHIYSDDIKFSSFVRPDDVYISPREQ